MKCLQSAAILVTLGAPLLPAQPGGLAGVLRDPSGARTPGARIDVRSPGAPAANLARISPAVNRQAPWVHEVIYSNAAGEFRLDTIEPGNYNLTIEAVGFSTKEVQGVQVDVGKTKSIEVELALAGDRLIRTGGGDIAAALDERRQLAAAPAAPQQNGAGDMLLRKVAPSYPASALHDRVEGTVVLNAWIAKGGTIQSLEPVNKQIDARLVEAATAAVRQWVYKPTLLNGEPVDFATEIEVDFTLKH